MACDTPVRGAAYVLCAPANARADSAGTLTVNVCSVTNSKRPSDRPSRTVIPSAFLQLNRSASPSDHPSCSSQMLLDDDVLLVRTSSPRSPGLAVAVDNFLVQHMTFDLASADSQSAQIERNTLKSTLVWRQWASTRQAPHECSEQNLFIKRSDPGVYWGAISQGWWMNAITSMLP